MSRYQVDPAAFVPIYEFEPGTRGDERPNVIYIRARMNVGQANLVLALTTTRGANGIAVADERAAEYLTAQMIVNIIRWEGPDFDDLPCTPETIRNLPGNDEFIRRVSNEIVARNRTPESPDEKKTIATGSHSNGSSASIVMPSRANRSANGIPISILPSATTGRRSK